MKKTLSYLIAIIILAAGATNASFAQKGTVPPVGCVDPSMRLQADGIKQHFTAQGFKVYRDAMINMESMVPFPVMVQLNRGQLYQIIFVGHPAATNHKIVLYDGADNKIDEKFITRHHGNDKTNYIIYSIVPERTDMYMFTFMTRLKNEHMCGSVCIVAADPSKGMIEYKPYTE
jgi:hypothetical protein